MRCVACDELPITITTFWSGRASRMPADTAINSSAMCPWRRSNSQPAAAQLPGRLGAKFRLQLVECGFNLDYGVSRQPDGT